MSLADGALGNPENGNISPLLNPEHWGGHSIGVGEPNAGTLRDPSLVAVATGLMKLSMFTGDTAVPIRERQFSTGEVLDIREQPSGMVVAYAKETLSGSKPVDKDELEEAAAAAAKPSGTSLEVPVSAHPRKKPPVSRAFDRYIEEGGRVYTASTYFGVLAVNGFGQKRFVGFPRGIFYQHDKSGKLTYTRLVVEPEPTQMRIGEVRHSRRGDDERLERINAVQVYRGAYTGKSRMRRHGSAVRRPSATVSINMA